MVASGCCCCSYCEASAVQLFQREECAGEGSPAAGLQVLKKWAR